MEIESGGNQCGGGHKTLKTLWAVGYIRQPAESLFWQAKKTATFRNGPSTRTKMTFCNGPAKRKV